VRRILVIDDEPLVATMLKRTLEHTYEVTIQNSGRAALTLLQAGQRYDAVVTDLNMHDGDGPWLHGEVMRIDPAQARKMIFISGAPHTFLDQPGVRSLMKPFRTAELVAQIEATVSAS
jgi:CheY-like chemotaxis protein